ncbi:hypothetical protein HY025_00300 [Candidatus Daviesbacteria bacterium]|nr:hypothetical protein [Candidatus Daviesbacteria bacterium]
MSRLFKIAVYLITTFLSVFLFSGVALAKTQDEMPMWDVRGTGSLEFVCVTPDTCPGGPFDHSINVTTENPDGTFSGTGYFIPDPATTWTVTGTLNSSAVAFHIVYTGTNPGYTIDGQGTISIDGSFNGIAQSNTSQGFSWHSTKGKAKLINP